MKNKLIVVFGIPSFSSDKIVSNAIYQIKNKIHAGRVCTLLSADYFDFSFESINTSLKQKVNDHDYTLCSGVFFHDVYPEKFFDIVCRNTNLAADLAVLALNDNTYFEQEILKRTIALIKEVYCLPLVVYINSHEKNSALEIFLGSLGVSCIYSIDVNFPIDSFFDFHTSSSYLYDYALSIKSKTETFIARFFPKATINYLNHSEDTILLLNKDYDNLPIYFSNLSKNYNIDATQFSIQKVCLKAKAGLILVDYAIAF